MKPLSIADCLDHLRHAAGERRRRGAENSPFRPRSLPADRLAAFGQPLDSLIVEQAGVTLIGARTEAGLATSRHRHARICAANFLKALKAQEGSWTLAVARYNAGPGNPAAERTYVCSVIRNMIASGFGAWTANARALCE